MQKFINCTGGLQPLIPRTTGITRVVETFAAAAPIFLGGCSSGYAGVTAAGVGVVAVSWLAWRRFYSRAELPEPMVALTRGVSERTWQRYKRSLMSRHNGEVEVVDGNILRLNGRPFEFNNASEIKRVFGFSDDAMARRVVYAWWAVGKKKIIDYNDVQGTLAMFDEIAGIFSPQAQNPSPPSRVDRISLYHKAIHELARIYEPMLFASPDELRILCARK